MYEKLVNRLRARADREDDYYEHAGDVINEAADAIEELIRQNKKWEEAVKTALDFIPCWVPATERLPKTERKSYWVCTDTGYQCECRWTNNRLGIGESDEWGWSIFDIPQYQKVVAWMPLPRSYEPPKEDTP